MPITNGYCTQAEVEARLRLQENTDYDDIVIDAVNAASRAIDAHCGRVFYSSVSSARVFHATNTDVIWIDDVQSVGTLKTDDGDDGTFETTWASTDFEAYPLNGRSGGITGHPVTHIKAVGDYRFPTGMRRACVQVTGAWGWAAVPEPVKSAALILAGAEVVKATAPGGIVGSDQFGPIRLPRDEKMMVEAKLLPYCRHGGPGLPGFA